MAVSAHLGYAGTEFMANSWPTETRLGSKWLLYAFAPLTALNTLVSAVLWTRRLKPSVLEAFGALVVAELMAWYVVAEYYGAWFGIFVLAFWVGASVVFAPWWGLGCWLGYIWNAARD